MKVLAAKRDGDGNSFVTVDYLDAVYEIFIRGRGDRRKVTATQIATYNDIRDAIAAEMESLS